jgi:hypothetical protein
MYCSEVVVSVDDNLFACNELLMIYVVSSSISGDVFAAFSCVVSELVAVSQKLVFCLQ